MKNKIFNNRGFATMIVLLIFLALSILVLIVVKKQHTTIDEATHSRLKSVSRSAAESAARQIIRQVVASGGATTGISVGYLSSNDSGLQKQVLIASLPAEPTAGSVNCANPVNNNTYQLTQNSSDGYFILPAQGLCRIDEDTYTLRVIGFSDQNGTVRTEVSAGFKK